MMTTMILSLICSLGLGLVGLLLLRRQFRQKTADQPSVVSPGTRFRETKRKLPMEILALQRCLNHLNREARRALSGVQTILLPRMRHRAQDRVIAPPASRSCQSHGPPTLRFASLAGIGQCLLGVLTA